MFFPNYLFTPENQDIYIISFANTRTAKIFEGTGFKMFASYEGFALSFGVFLRSWLGLVGHVRVHHVRATKDAYHRGRARGSKNVT